MVTGGSNWTAVVFGDPAAWRVEAAQELALTGDDLIGALSPAVCCPVGLRPFLAALPHGGGGIVDIGAGTGAIGAWLRRESGREVHCVEPVAEARAAASAAFPELRVVAGDAADTGLADAAFDGVVLCGVLSLVGQAGPVIGEAERLLGGGGVLAVLDLFSSSRRSWRQRANTFRSMEGLSSLLRLRGWDLLEVGFGRPEPQPSWMTAAARVDEWIERHRRHEPSFEAWSRDRRMLGDAIESGEVAGACLVARRPSCVD